MHRSLLALSLAVALTSQAHAQVATNRREVRVARATSTIAVEGRLTEPAWQAVEVCTAFVQRDPVEGGRPSQRTEVRVLYDENALYVGARLYDNAPDSIVTELARRDGGSRSDKFFVYLDPYYDRRSGYYFALNSAGTQYDGTLYNDSWEDNSWDGVWEGKSRRDDEGWVVEMRIPFSQLRFARADVQKWGINFGREIARGFENVCYVCRPKKSSGFVSLFPTLVGLQNVNPTNAIEIVPYVTSKGEFISHEPGDPFNDGSEWSPGAGADLRMPVGSKLTLNGTINPDFGQVEVDPAVVNLSDVETFFPEKRPFFVEGSSIFQAGQQGANDYWGFNFSTPTFFYSRRIGHAPEGPLPDESGLYSDVPPGTTILGAAKLSGKPTPSLNFGTLHTVTAKELATHQRPDETRFESIVEPLAYYGVVRTLKEFPERRHGLGAMATYAHRRLDDASIENQFNEDAVMGVVDGWHFLDRNQTWVVSGFAAGSWVGGTPARMVDVQTNSRRYFQRPDAESFSVDPDATSLSGGAARLWLNKQKGNWLSNSAVGFLSPGFEINDLGFQSRADVINAHAGLGYKWTDPTKHLKNHNFLGAVFGNMDFDGNVTGAGAWGKGFWWYTNNWVLEISSAYNPQTVNPRRSRGGPLMLNEPGYELFMFGDTDGSRVRYYNFSTYHYMQPEENSYVHNAYPFIAYKPAGNIRFEIGPGWEEARDGAFYVATIPDAGATATFGNRYVFAQLDQTTISANIRLNVSFTPTMSLQFYGQPLIATGTYTDYRELAEPKTLDFLRPGESGSGSWTYDPATGEFDRDGPGTASEPEILDFNIKSLRGNAVFRWEFMPGSAFYLVWTQQRNDYENTGELDLGNSFRRMIDADAANIFLAKLTYYLNW
jgi:hypothetical protein